MPRGRKKAAENDGEDANAGGDAKRVKLSPPLLDALDKYPVRFDWEGEGGKWMTYDQESMLAICDAINKKKKQVPLTLGSVSFVIDIVKSVQKNKKTGWERRVRLCIQTDDKKPDDYIVWEYMDKSWQPFGIQPSIHIQKAEADEDNEVEVTSGRRKFKIDLSELEQTNIETDAVSKIRRTKAKADIAVKSEPGTSADNASVSAKSAPKAKAKSGESATSENQKPATNKSGAKGKSTAKVKSDPEETKVKSVIVKGKAPVDPECTSKVSSAHVYCEGKDVYDCMLNQTNLQNNNNKYYLCQLLEDDTSKRYTVWFRWGRVGKIGQNSLLPCGADLERAKHLFTQKFQDKTKNQWANRSKFCKVGGKYDLLHMDYGTDNNTNGADDERNVDNVKREIPDSELDARIQALIELICDVKSMEDAVMEMKYDSKKAPLGKLTDAQIKAGYSALKAIDECIRQGVKGQKLLQACNDFYTRVPHDFGMTRPPLIQSKEEVKLKLSLLEALGDIQIAMTMLKEDEQSSENPVDRHYKSLDINLQTVDKNDDQFKMVNDYIQFTHAKTHNHYKMVLEELFLCSKQKEKDQFNDVGNRMLLWHGSRLTNWVGILKQGLRIAPPEAPVTGYMFGKGVYFADMSSKSANYCFTTKSKNTGLLLLCDVALGKANELLASDYNAHKLPAGCQSVKGLGSVAPEPSTFYTTPDGVVVPKGKGHNTGVDNPSGYTLNYNEYIVYDPRQIQMKYLCKIKMNYR